MLTDPELCALWSLALRGASIAVLLRYLDAWPSSYRPRVIA